MVTIKGARKSLLKQLKFTRAFAKSFKEFLSKTFVHSYHYLVEPNRHIVEKIMWSCIHLTMTISAIYIVMFAWSRFTENPTITTLESQHHSIFDAEFPAVAICSNNKISKWRAEEYADFLSTTPQMPAAYRDKIRLTRLVRYMGRLYDGDIEGVEEFGNFQDILDLVDSNKSSGIYNSKRKLQAIAPNCSDYIVKCKWGGKFFDCSQMISLQLTVEGFCCMFNYVKGNKIRTTNAAMPPAGIGPDMGLTVLVNLSSEDYFYPLKNFLGATALIFNPQEFADSGTGGVREVPIEPFQEVRITLNVNTKIAVDEVQRYSIEKRGCMFANDLPDEYHGDYVYADCMVKCKLKSIIALCKCKPFNLPNDFEDIPISEFPYCSLAEIPCINKYRIKWLTYRPREAIRGLEREIEDSLNCFQCYPLCSSSTYSVDSTATQLNFFYENRGSVIAKMNESQDLSVIKVYFPQKDSVLYQTTVLYAWYDIVSDYGGILSLCLGCSIISFIEVVYFLTVRFYQNLFNSSSFKNKFNQKKPNKFDTAPKLYRPKFEYLH